MLFSLLKKQVSRVQTHHREKRGRDRKRDSQRQCVTDVAMAPALLPRTQDGLIDETFSCTKKPKRTELGEIL